MERYSHQDQLSGLECLDVRRSCPPDKHAVVLETLAALATETMAGRDRSRLNSVVPGQQQGSEAAIIAEPGWISETEMQSRGRGWAASGGQRWARGRGRGNRSNPY